ncbi:porin, partial [Burkholderia pseudomallei]
SGLLDAGVSYVNHSKSASGSDTLSKYDDGIAQGSRWGLRGAADLGGGLKAIFVLEIGVNRGHGTFGQGGAICGRRAGGGVS